MRSLKLAFRTLAKSPFLSAVAILSLALGIGANAAIYSLFDQMVLRALPVHEPGQLVNFANPGPKPGSQSCGQAGDCDEVFSYPMFRDLEEQAQRSFVGIAAHVAFGANLAYQQQTINGSGLLVSGSYFPLLGVQPALGRLLGPGDDRTIGGHSVAVLSHTYWVNRLGADPNVLNKTILINGQPMTVVGVAARGFEGTTLGNRPDVFVPLTMRGQMVRGFDGFDNRRMYWAYLFGRLKPGATAADVTRDLSAAIRRVTDRTGMYRNWSVLAEPMHEASVLAVRPILWTVSAAVALVLLIALVNLATLFRIRTLGRADELNVRLALGGGPLRVARVLALEAGGLALAGAVVGLALAGPLLARVRAIVPLYVQIPESAARVPVLRAVLDPGVAAVTAAMAVLGALALTAPGLISAVRRRSAAHGGRSHGTRGIRWLVAAELALATVLCLGAGLTTRSAGKLLGTDVGLEDEGLLTLWFGDAWGMTAPEMVSYYRQVVQAVEEVPGVTSAALIDYIPFEGEDDFEGIEFLDRALQPTERVREEWRRVTEGVFETAGMRVQEGRSFTSEDFEGMPRAAVVNEAFARKHYPGGDAVGRFLNTGNDHYQGLEVVGVVADVRSRGPASPAPPMLYVPNQGEPRGTVGMYVRVAAGSPMGVVEPVREAIWSVDPSQPIARIFGMSDVVAQWVAIPRAVRTLVSGLAALALLLAAVGVFGVVAYAVRSRTAELGVRLALGASPARLAREVLLRAVPMVALGLGAGLGAGYLAARGARAVLYGVAPLDPLSMGVAVLAMAGAAIVATWVPARRIAGIDPTAAIRSE